MLGEVPSGRESGFLRMASTGPDPRSDKIVAWTAAGAGAPRIVTARIRVR